MNISDELMGQFLTENFSVDKSEVKKLQKQATKSKKSLQQVALVEGLVDEDKLLATYADQIEIPIAKVNSKKLDPELVKLLPEHIARRYRAVIFGRDDSGLKLAIEDPDNFQAIDFIKKSLSETPELYVASTQTIDLALDAYSDNDGDDLAQVITDQTEGDAEEEVSKADLAEDSPIAQTVNLIIQYAVKAGASDVHIEPREKFVQVRYRIDGVLKEADKLPKRVQAALASRIKILSGLKIDERRIPQDGRFKINQSGKNFALRVSTLPIADGEKIVIRLLDESNNALSMEDLGFWGNSLDVINNAIIQPHGMVLVTGPTGSGKSTTLFSVLSLLNKPSVNISTVEDPIEYRIIGANQTQINQKAGMTFASGLRALLRQDPNIIMVGEVRDKETADMSVQAALTGHLVFSTLHTNNAATCLPRLLDMGVEPFLIASTVRAVLGQRLVRRLCPECRVEYKPEHDQLDELARVFDIASASKTKHLHELEELAKEQGIGSKVQSTSSSGNKILRLWKAKEDGCDSCGGIGYRGRIGIYEVLENTVEIQHMIMDDTTSDIIQNKAIDQGMVTMQVDGLVKSLRGETTVEEVMRVTRE